MIDITSALRQATNQLEDVSPSPRIDAEVLLCHCIKQSRTYLYTYSDKPLTDQEYQDYQQLIHQRHQGQPIAYITGEREFWSMSLKVNEQTLIPRPATEKLVEVTLELLKDQAQAKVLDLGTGSGAVALALAKERPDWNITASDKNPKALALAKENAKHLGLKNIQFYLSDWFMALPEQRYHAIVSNPPYIAENDPHLQQGDLRYEPIEALVSGKDGLHDIKEIIIKSSDFLLSDGYLLIEHGYDQKHQIEGIFQNTGYTHIKCWKDSEGNDRISGGQL